MTTDNKKPFTVYQMNEEGSKLEELEELGRLVKLPLFNANGELKEDITKLAAKLDEREATISFAKALDAIHTTKHSCLVGEDSTKLEIFDEWKHLESKQYVHSFWNNSSNYQVDFTFVNKDARRQLKIYQDKAASYLQKNSALFTSFGREDAKMKTDLFDMKCFVSDGKRIVKFSPKKMKVFHITIWGADILSDVEIDTNNKAVIRQLIDIKVEIDRWNMITGFFIISDGVASAYPMIEFQKEFQAKMKDIGAREIDRASAPFIIEGNK